MIGPQGSTARPRSAAPAKRSLARRVFAAVLLAPVLLGCGRSTDERVTTKRSAEVTPPVPSRRPARPLEPTRLVELPVSAYATTLSLDDDAAYLMTPNAAYRLVPGEPLRRIELDLGFGATLTGSGLVYWSKGRILRTPKAGGEIEDLAGLPDQPQYFVASGDVFVWVARDEGGSHAIGTLRGREPQILVSSKTELSALDLVADAVYFIERPTDGSWRIGVVSLAGGKPKYGAEHKGRRPALLTGTDAIYYWDVDTRETRHVSLDLREEEVLLRDLVCSPLHAASNLYCGCVEGLFGVSKSTHEPRVLSFGRPGSITNVQSDARRVVWTVDLGRDRLAVDSLATTDVSSAEPDARVGP